LSRNEKIGAAAQDEKGKSGAACEAADDADFLCRIGHEKTIRRAADAESGVAAHGFIEADLVVAEDGGKKFFT